MMAELRDPFLLSTFVQEKCMAAGAGLRKRLAYQMGDHPGFIYKDSYSHHYGSHY